MTTRHDDKGHEHDPAFGRFRCTEESGEGISRWQYEYEPKRSGPRAYGVRVLPAGARAERGVDLSRALVVWC